MKGQGEPEKEYPTDPSPVDANLAGQSVPVERPVSCRDAHCTATRIPALQAEYPSADGGSKERRRW